MIRKAMAPLLSLVTLAIALHATCLIRPVLAQQPSTVRVDSREQFVQALGRAEAGTTILLAPGEYRGGISQRDLQGTSRRPIVIAAADPSKPPVFVAGGSGLQLSNVAYLELRDLIFRGARGNGINLDDGGSKSTPSRHVRLVRLTVRDVGPGGNRDGIKLSGVDDFLIRDCTLQHWGDRGSAIDMVGCHRGTIEGCDFEHREDADGANGVQTKGGSSEITIRRCRFTHSGGRAVNVGGSTGMAYFRPEPQGFEAKQITVEDCTFIGSLAPIAFVGVDGATVRYNTIYRPRRWVVRILQETQLPEFVACRGGRFTHNVIAFRSDELSLIVNVGANTAPETFEFADNAWYCIDRPEQTRQRIRLPVPETGANYGVDPSFADPSKGDLRVQSETVDAGVRDAEPESR